MRLTDLQIAALARAAGFTGPDLIVAVAVCLAESRGNTDAVSSTLDYGLWQIHQSAWPNLLTPAMVTAGTWKDPAKSAGWAYHIWHALGWTMWSTYKSGSYKTYMARSTAAVGGETMSKADQLRATAVAHVGDEYEWSEEGKVNPATGKPQEDCSGLIDLVARTLKLPWSDGTTWHRTTAHGYGAVGVKLPNRADWRAGCFFVFRNAAGHGYHTGWFIGNNETVEARGERWGVVRYSLDDPKNGVLARGLLKHGGVYHFPWLYATLGALSTTAPAPAQLNWPTLESGMHYPAVKALKVILNRAQGAGLDPHNDYFGDNTEREVVELQAACGLDPDGVVGPNTRAVLATL